MRRCPIRTLPKRAALGLKGARVMTPADYGRVIEIERAAAAMGYARLD
jgi:hypothetical protein